MNRMLIGAVAGVAATTAMTVAMSRLHRRLPAAQRYPLPPREITDDLARRTRLPLGASEPARQTMSLASHIAFGAATGAAFGLLSAGDPATARRLGVPYSLGIWAASYLGWIPALAILSPATRHPRRRTELMLAAHVVWGGVLGLATAELARSSEAFGRAEGDPDEDRAVATDPHEDDERLSNLQRPEGGASVAPHHTQVVDADSLADRASEDSFPASDPPAQMSAGRVGQPPRT